MCRPGAADWMADSDPRTGNVCRR
uniref:Uncharacterized protein n=1 Tax=Anguilla anguilla TaxID=7936 RepID=A0A0E9VKV2_ANGAN